MVESTLILLPFYVLFIGFWGLFHQQSQIVGQNSKTKCIAIYTYNRNKKLNEKKVAEKDDADDDDERTT